MTASQIHMDQNNMNQPDFNNQQPQQPQQPQYQPVQTHNVDSKATLALVMGLVSIISWIIPLAGLATTIIGITAGKTGMNSPTGKGKAIAGLVLSIIFLVVTGINMIAGALMAL